MTAPGPPDEPGTGGPGATAGSFGCACDGTPLDPAAVRAAMRDWWLIGIGAVIAANTMALSLAINVNEAPAGQRLGIHLALLAACALVAGLLGGPLAARAWDSVRRRRMGIEGLFVSGLTGALGASVLATATGSGPVYYEVVIILLVIYAFGRRLTRSSQERALALVEIWRGAPESCERIGPDGGTEWVAVASMRPGDRARVHPGRVIPVDGVIVAGGGFVREAQLTGESFVTARVPGERVYAGLTSVDGTLDVRATAPGDARRIDAIARAVEQARRRPSGLVSEADRLARWFLPTVTGAALATFLGWGLGAGWREGLMNALAVLLVACPCAMGFATPVAVWAAIGGMARRGLLARDGALVEKLAGANLVVADKTGTLTQPEPELADLVFAPATPAETQRWRSMIAGLQHASDHPLAAPFHAIGSAGAGGVIGVRVLAGRGIEGDIVLDGRPCRVRIGSSSIFESEAELVRWQELASRLRAAGGSRIVAAAVDGRAVLAAALGERSAEGAFEALAALQSAVGPLWLLTGDREDRAQAFARGVCFEKVIAGASPEHKQDLLARLRIEGRRVLFIGDGINDAGAMAESHVSVAMGGGARLAAETADGVLMGGDLRALPEAVALCRRAVAAIRGNLRIAAGYNAIGIGIAAAGLLHPVTAAIIMTCSSLIVTWRALRLLEAAEGDEIETGAAATGGAPRESMAGVSR